jgi:hypothetical protein
VMDRSVRYKPEVDGRKGMSWKTVVKLSDADCLAGQNSFTYTTPLDHGTMRERLPSLPRSHRQSTSIIILTVSGNDLR